MSAWVMWLSMGATLSACATGSGGGKSAAPPAWVVSPPMDTDSEVYGLGEGMDLASAKRVALRDVAGKFSVSVAGVSSNSTSVHNSQVSRSASTAVSEEVRKTEFKSYTLVDSAPSPAGVYALVKVDRSQFIDDTRARIQRLMERVSMTLAGAGRTGGIEHWIALQRVVPLLEVQQGLYGLFSARDLRASDTEMKREIEQLATRAKNDGRALSVSVRGAREDADVVSALAGFVVNSGLRVVPAQDTPVGFVDVALEQRADRFQRDHIVRLSVTVSVRDAAQRVVSTKNHVVSGASMTDFAAARQTALRKWQADLQSSGLVSALGVTPLVSSEQQ